ncbi:MAG: HD-GYP domain-containing protein [Spirochaetaceae bacterium]|jgi:HD-GYP domain-containing protein (c-di-GMP phosphodiesterase class II)|nr:HD-GYP domain-containing protein [Spirochaetaceae bacterium]
MKKIPVKSLRAGLSFTEPVYIEGNNILVPAGIAIRKKDLERLTSWGVDSVTTDGQMIAAKEQGPGKDSDEAKKDKEQKSGGLLSLTDVKENSGAYRAYTDIISKLDEVFNNIGAGVSIEVRSIDNITGSLLHVVREQRDQIIGFILGGEVSGRELAKSSVNTAILTALIALEMKLPNHRVMQITTGALLHDAGMLRLPKEITEKKGGLSAAEVQRMQAHPLYTYKIICKELLYPEDVGAVALQHHERWDGEGYPRRISGAAIDLGARIVSVADAFEAMVSEKPYRNSMMGYQAMKNLLSDNSRRFDPDVLKAFIQTMGIYPIGSIILLNNGAIARVVEVRGDAPLRPNIRILIDEFGKVFKQDEGDIIELLTEKSLFIAKALDPRELNKKK